VVSSRQRLAHAYKLRGRPGDAEAARQELATARSEAAAFGIPVPDLRIAGPHSGAFAACDRVGRKWRLALLDRSVLVEDSIGMLHLAVLVASPRREIPAADLVAGLAVLGSAAATTRQRSRSWTPKRSLGTGPG